MMDPLEWRESLRKHYASLDEFNDRRSTEIMLGFTNKMIGELELMRNDIMGFKPEWFAEQEVALFDAKYPELGQLRELKAELEAWLEKKRTT